MVATFDMNPKFTEVTPNSFIFVMNNFCRNPVRKFMIIDIIQKISFCLPPFDFVNEILRVTN